MLVFVVLVTTGQGLVYLLRTRGPYWESPPGGWQFAASDLDLAVMFLLASRGIRMAAVPARLVAGVYRAAGMYLVLLDFVKYHLLHPPHAGTRCVAHEPDKAPIAGLVAR